MGKVNGGNMGRAAGGFDEKGTISNRSPLYTDVDNGAVDLERLEADLTEAMYALDGVRAIMAEYEAAAGLAEKEISRLLLARLGLEHSQKLT